jgi:hypothetical protein
MELFDSTYDIYMVFRSYGDKKSLSKKTREIVKSFQIPVHFKDSKGHIVVDSYNNSATENTLVFKKLINNYESISLVQTIKCNCPQIKVHQFSDSLNKDINSCHCFIKENIKRIKPFRIYFKDLQIMFKFLNQIMVYHKIIN